MSLHSVVNSIKVIRSDAFFAGEGEKREIDPKEDNNEQTYKTEAEAYFERKNYNNDHFSKFYAFKPRIQLYFPELAKDVIDEIQNIMNDLNMKVFKLIQESKRLRRKIGKNRTEMEYVNKLRELHDIRKEIFTLSDDTISEKLKDIIVKVENVIKKNEK